MRKTILLTVTLLTIFSVSVSGMINNESTINPTLKMEEKDIQTMIITLERKALEEWNKGNPDGYLEIYAPDITYFDPYLEKRVDGYDEIKKLYDEIKGTFSVEQYEMVNPVVQISQNTAVLTFNLISHSGGEVYKWNCSEVYKLHSDNQWKIIHTHWSFIRPMDEKK